jgi:hypothetical protein
MSGKCLDLRFRRNRRYAQRFPDGHSRLEMVCSRVRRDARESIGMLAERRGMSVSEYIARLINDHIRRSAVSGNLM